MKLLCTANAFVKGELVKKGVVADYDTELAKQLLASGRFSEVPETDEVAPAKGKGKKAAEPDA